jgi:hypothetical protein
MTDSECRLTVFAERSEPAFSLANTKNTVKHAKPHAPLVQFMRPPLWKSSSNPDYRVTMDGVPVRSCSNKPLFVEYHSRGAQNHSRAFEGYLGLVLT